MATATTVPAWVSKHYKDIQLLGRGSFGSVIRMRKKSWWKETPSVACKIVDVTKDKRLKEAEIMITLHGLPGIVSLQKCHQDSTCSCMVMELCDCDLSKAISKGLIPENKVAEHFRRLVKTVQGMHKRRVVHRDLKPDNVLVSKNKELKVADFGAATYFSSGTQIRGVEGTLQYMAPEMVLKKRYDEKVDIYSLGLILYYMLEKKVPFSGDPLKPNFFTDRRLEFERAPNEARDLIKSMTCNNPARRCTLAEVLKHPWLLQ